MWHAYLFFSRVLGTFRALARPFFFSLGFAGVLLAWNLVQSCSLIVAAYHLLRGEGSFSPSICTKKVHAIYSYIRTRKQNTKKIQAGTDHLFRYTQLAGV